MNVLIRKMVKKMDNDKIIKLGKLYNNLRDWSIYDKNGICPTLTAACGGGGGHVPMILESEVKEHGEIRE